MKEFLNAIRETLQPQAHAEATAATFADFIATTQIEPLALKRGLLELETPRPNDAPHILARRRTCGELAQLIKGNAVGSMEYLHKAVDSWDRWFLINRAKLNESTELNPRLSAITDTADRELSELQDLI